MAVTASELAGGNSRRRAAELAADAVRRLIFDGHFAPGQRLIEIELLAELPVGRSTLREAFTRLSGEGLVELTHQRGARVKRLTRAAMAELFEVRECLEGFAARLAAERVHAQPEQRRWLEHERATWQGDAVLSNELTHMEHNVPLHDGIVTIAGNQRLAEALRPLQIPAYRLQFLRLLDRKQRETSAAEHLDIIDAILDGRAAVAERLTRAHVRRAATLAQAIPGLA